MHNAYHDLLGVSNMHKLYLFIYINCVPSFKISFSGVVKSKRSIWRLKTITDFFWAIINFIGVFFATMFSVILSSLSQSIALKHVNCISQCSLTSADGEV